MTFDKIKDIIIAQLDAGNTTVETSIKDAVYDWRKVATHCHISPTEQQRFAKRLEYCL